MKKYDVICPMCCGTFHETTAQFDHDRMAHGAMFEAKQHVKDAAWSVFPPYESTDAADCVCPGCGAQYCDSMGRVIRLQECGEIEVVTITVDGVKMEGQLFDLPADTEIALKVDVVPPRDINAEMERLMAEYDVEVPESKDEFSFSPELEASFINGVYHKEAEEPKAKRKPGRPKR